MTSDSGNRDGGKKGEKTLKGCIQSSRGQYTLKGKNGKMVNLNSSGDLSIHLGHMVALHGNWGAKGSSDVSSSPSSSAAGSNHMFYVNSVDMISDTCIGLTGKHSNSAN
ncbi:MAG: hypothetical protein NVS1B11_17870 [Terriglobales bacterium]